MFCVGSDRGLMRLYDPRNYERGPFATFMVCLLIFLISTLPA